MPTVNPAQNIPYPAYNSEMQSEFKGSPNVQCPTSLGPCSFVSNMIAMITP